MNLKNNALYFVAKKLIGRNEKFKGLHNGESCYLFGNGASLKYFDLKKFNDKISIGSNALFLHRHLKDLNLKYSYHGHPYSYYPYWWNPWAKKYEKNRLGSVYKEKSCLHRNINFFVNLSNCFSLSGRNIYYTHHFGEPFVGFDTCRLDRDFTAGVCGLGGMIGLALYMGFEDITLVGCDYSFFPQSQGHFFTIGRFADTYREEPHNEKFLLAAAKFANLRIVTPSESYRGHILPSISYEELTGDFPIYKENDEIVSKQDLLSMNSRSLPFKIFPARA